MKLIQQFILAVAIFMILSVSASWAGADGLFVVYQLEKSSVDGRLNLRPVEIEFDMAGATNPTYGVFAEWLRPFIHDTDKIDLQQVNKAYCKGLNFEIRHAKREHIDVFLDYTACNGKNKPTSAKDKLLEGIAAAILYTENAPNMQPVRRVSLHIKGILNKKEIINDYSWTVLQKKWQPYVASFQERCK